MKISHDLKNKILVSDGAMGTMLQQQGLPVGHCPEEWNIIHPDIISSIHKNYYDAGADIAETNTFGGNFYRLKHHNLADKIYELNKAAAVIAKSVCPENKYVAGSVGPTGEFLQPLGLATMEDLENSFEEQIHGLVDGGVDVLFIETMSYLEEIFAVISAAQKIKDDLPLVASMTFEKTTVGYRTMMGVSISEFVEEIKNKPVIAFGANCGKGADEMNDIMKEFRTQTDRPLIAQANAGLPESVNDKIIYNETFKERGNLTRALIQNKINIIGGCCGTTPGHIKAICEARDKYQNK